MREALIIVDMQNDFVLPSGPLYVPGSLEIVGGITEEILKFERRGELVIASACWHPYDHCSFQKYGGQWPAHCIQGTEGARLQTAIRNAITYEIYKGKSKDKEEYSAFEVPELHAMLSQREVEMIRICGVAKSICVAHTAEAAKKLGYKVDVLEKLCRDIKK